MGCAGAPSSWASCCRSAGSIAWTAMPRSGPGTRSAANRSARRGRWCRRWRPGRPDLAGARTSRSAHVTVSTRRCGPGGPRSGKRSDRREPLHVVLLDKGRAPVGAGDVGDAAGFADATVVDPHRALAQPRQLAGRVADEEQRAGAAEIVDPVDALLLEGEVAHRQRFVDDEDLGVDVRADGEGEPHAHADRIELQRLVHEGADAGEIGYRFEFAQDLLALQPEHGAADQHVLASRGLEVERRAERQHRGDPALDPDLALGRARHAADDLQQCGLAATVAPDDAQALAALDLEADVLQRPERLVIGVLLRAEQLLLHPVLRTVVKLVGLRELPRPDHDFGVR